ncbi:hypothetical protein [Listeria booriae]|uniref:hypothetical protein n=1 Tax=Listeria booriae TaxID=1552123 RepID=UPI001623FB68|nr:hypothetical protein [Listeria booriae]MBC2149486.1 hypothetical protein [Listeria booriae]
MADISKEMGVIRNSIYASEVRGDIVSSLVKVNDEVVNGIGAVEQMKNNRGLLFNKGAKYPVYYTGGVNEASIDHQVIINGILGLTVDNADMNYHYTLRYLANNQSTYGDLIMFSRIHKTTGEETVLQTTKKVVRELDRAGLNTFQVKSESSEELFTITIDYSVIPDGWFSNGSAGTPFRSNRVAMDCIHYTKPKNNVLVADFESEEFLVSARYKDYSDITICFKPYGVNGIMSMQSIYKNSWNEYLVPGKTTSMISTSTDWISPHQLEATTGENDAVSVTDGWSGGTHGTSGGTGEPTAQMTSFRIEVNGLEVTTSGHYNADDITIEVVNDIEARNTHTVKRFVLRERVRYTIIGACVHVDTTYHFKEDVTWSFCKSMQTVGSYWTLMSIKDSPVEGFVSIENSANIQSGPKKDYPTVDTRILKNKNADEFLKVYLDLSTDLGKRMYLNDTDVLMESLGSTNKTYTPVVINKNVSISSGTIHQWRGYYEFL